MSNLSLSLSVLLFDRMKRSSQTHGLFSRHLDGTRILLTGKSESESESESETGQGRHLVRLVSRRMTSIVVQKRRTARKPFPFFEAEHQLVVLLINAGRCSEEMSLEGLR